MKQLRKEIKPQSFFYRCISLPVSHSQYDNRKRSKQRETLLLCNTRLVCRYNYNPNFLPSYYNPSCLNRKQGKYVYKYEVAHVG